VYIAYLNVLLTYGMETAFFRFYNTEKKPLSVFSTSFISLLATALMALIVLLLYAEPISAFMGFDRAIYFQLLISIAILDTVMVIPFAYLRVLGKSKSYSLYKVLNALIFGVFNILFLVYLPLWTEGGKTISFYDPNLKEGYIFIANLIASVFTFFCLLSVIRKVEWVFDWSLWKKMMSYAWPVLVAGLAFTTNENLDKLVLDKLLGPEAMGAYAGAYKIGVIMMLYILAFRLGAEPFFFNLAKSENAKQTYAIVTKWFTILGVIFMLFVVVFIEPIAGLLLRSPDYMDALGIVPIILAANLFLGIYNNLSVFLFTSIPILGYFGAAWATFVAYGVMMLISFVLGRRHYLVPYEYLRISLYLLFGIGFSFVHFYSFKNNYILGCLGILAFLTILFFAERATINKILKQV
jgi:O-antigen/teichoic acid export membrane protein